MPELTCCEHLDCRRGTCNVLHLIWCRQTNRLNCCPLFNWTCPCVTSPQPPPLRSCFAPRSKGVLISWTDCIALGILHADYPRSLFRSKPEVEVSSIPENPTTEQVNQIREAIVTEYRDVFDRMLSGKLPVMAGKKMTIQLRDGAVSHYEGCGSIGRQYSELINAVTTGFLGGRDKCHRTCVNTGLFGVTCRWRMESCCTGGDLSIQPPPDQMCCSDFTHHIKALYVLNAALDRRFIGLECPIKLFLWWSGVRNVKRDA